jgi:putative effector of murein hydrolase LrgA (UPF0299 family)
MFDKTESNFLFSFKSTLKAGFLSLLEYIKLLIIALILSYILGFILLFIYTAEYGAPFPIYSNLLTNFAKLFFILFGIGVMFSVGPENLFKFVSSLIVGATIIIMVLGIFAKWQYSPQRYILNLYDKGGKTVSYRIKKTCNGVNLQDRTFLIYKGKHMDYFSAKNSVIGINKDCIVK